MGEALVAALVDDLLLGVEQGEDLVAEEAVVVGDVQGGEVVRVEHAVAHHLQVALGCLVMSVGGWVGRLVMGARSSV